MAGNLKYLTKSLLNIPQLITENQFTVVSEFLNDRNAITDLKTVRDMEEKMGMDNRNPSMKSETETGVAIMNVSGPLSHKATFFDAMCGAASYESMSAHYDKLVADEGIHTIVLQVDSGGGEARGCFAFAQHLKDTKGDKKLIAYTDSVAASAAYAIASVADEVILSDDAEVGSIGVISQLITREKQLEEAGVKVETIFAGKGKDLGNPARSMTDKEREQMQERVEVLYADFVSHVSENRDLAQDFIIDSLGAKLYRGQDAVDKGLADEVMSFSEFANYLGDLEDGETPSTSYSMETGIQMSKDNLEVLEAKMAEMAEKMTEMSALNESLTAAAEATLAKETEAKVANLTTVAEAWAGFGVDAKAYATAALEGSVPVEMFDAAMASAIEKLEAKETALEESAAMEELGETTLEAEPVTAEMKEREATRKALGQTS